jgi:hypothetical protein
MISIYLAEADMKRFFEGSNEFSEFVNNEVISLLSNYLAN